MEAKILDELSEHIAEWLKGRGLLGPNETLKISVNIVPAKTVEIDIPTLNSENKLIENLLSKMKKRVATRVYNQLFRYGVTLTMIKNESLRGMRRRRNVGTKTLAEFADALTDSGIECIWVNELRSIQSKHK